MAEDLDLREGLDGLLGDMAAHQRRFGEVTAESNRTLAASTIERLEREIADEKPLPAPAPVQPHHSHPALIGGTEKREGAHGRYIVNKSLTDDTGNILTFTEDAAAMQKIPDGYTIQAFGG